MQSKQSKSKLKVRNRNTITKCEICSKQKKNNRG